MHKLGKVALTAGYTALLVSGLANLAVAREMKSDCSAALLAILWGVNGLTWVATK